MESVDGFAGLNPGNELCATGVDVCWCSVDASVDGCLQHTASRTGRLEGYNVLNLDAMLETEEAARLCLNKDVGLHQKRPQWP